ncbi:hypothetical protein GCM10008967_37920 [Bacillus carboniphilus]|uniref:Polymerase nucleotidyl transferase domain-containing protein n=1 Tax=Bacillus carboniphilus TaxID=86663 RepID=A0ABN0WQ44_9BACI
MSNLRAGFGLDHNGYIVSDVSKDKIEPIYTPCIQESVENLSKLFPDQLHSVYIYGSVARGEAIINKSDLDLLALFNDSLSPDEIKKIKSIAGDLSQKNQSLVRDVGIAVGYYNYMIDPANYYEMAFLKELCVCVHGEDLRSRFGPYKLTSEIAISFNGDIRDVLTRTISRLEAASTEELKSITQSFARKLIRTYYSMVMARSQIWSTRIHEQSEVFINYFPPKKAIISTLHEWIENPPTDRKIVIEFFMREGKWASDNFVHEAKST